jgi:hypothetical protein
MLHPELDQALAPPHRNSRGCLRGALSRYRSRVCVWLVIAVIALAFICGPLLPGVRSLPRLIPIHGLVWREHYRALRP